MGPEQMVELSGLIGLPVVELTGADCNIGSHWSVFRGNCRIKWVGWITSELN